MGWWIAGGAAVLWGLVLLIIVMAQRHGRAEYEKEIADAEAAAKAKADALLGQRVSRRDTVERLRSGGF